MHTAKQYEGNLPPDGDFVAEVEGFTLYKRQKQISEKYMAFKLVANIPQNKSNYWLAWSMSEMRFIGRDGDTLTKNWPDIAKKISSIIAEGRA